jgi:hypothetical protein
MAKCEGERYVRGGDQQGRRWTPCTAEATTTRTEWMGGYDRERQVGTRTKVVQRFCAECAHDFDDAEAEREFERRAS